MGNKFSVGSYMKTPDCRGECRVVGHSSDPRYVRVEWSRDEFPYTSWDTWIQIAAKELRKIGYKGDFMSSPSADSFASSDSMEWWDRGERPVVYARNWFRGDL